MENFCQCTVQSAQMFAQPRIQTLSNSAVSPGLSITNNTKVK